MPTPNGTYKSTIKQGSDEKGASYGNYDNGTGNLYQQNSKEKNGEHYWYNNATGKQGWHGANYEKPKK